MGIARNLRTVAALMHPFRQVSWLTQGLVVCGALLFATSGTAQAQATAMLLSPANGATITTSPVTFSWASATGAQAYYLYVGTAVGLKDVVDSGETTATSLIEAALPSGTTLYVRLYTKQPGGWVYTDTTFTTGTLAAVLTQPANGAKITSSPVTFMWAPVRGALAYYLYVGAVVGLKDVVNSGETTATSLVETGLPSGKTLYVRLYTKQSGGWVYTDTTITTGPLAALLTSPANGATIPTSPVTFSWAAASGALTYYLYVGTAVGLKDVVNSGETTATSLVEGALPSGRTLYARLNTKLPSGWVYTDSTFTTGANAAFLISPTSGASATASPVTFRWAPANGAAAYYLYVGTAVGLKDVVNSGATTATSLVEAGLPSGKTLYARLYTQQGSGWVWTDSTFTTAPLAATLKSPANGATVNTSPVTFSWTPVNGATSYYLYVGTAAGLKDVVNSGATTATALTEAGLPSNATLYVRLYTLQSGDWVYTDSTLATQSLAATLPRPVNFSAIAAGPITLTWAPVTGAQAYMLRVGTAPGLSDVVDSGPTTSTSLVATLPTDETLYARLWTQQPTGWVYTDSTFSTGTGAAVLTTPSAGAPITAPYAQFSWTPVHDALAYYLYVGTAMGLKDLVDSGETQATSLVETGIPAGATVYVRLYTKHASGWVYNDSTFVTPATAASRAAADPSHAYFTTPVNGQVGTGQSVSFAWTAVPGAIGYELQLGTTVGGSDLFASGVITSLSTQVSNLQAQGVVYARVHALLPGDTIPPPAGHWSRGSALAFRVDANISGAPISYPLAGTVAAANLPVQWVPDPIALAYRVRVGTTPDGSDVDDSGPILVDRRFVPYATSGSTLYLTLDTVYLTRIVSRTIPFIAGTGSPAESDLLAVASALTGEVRLMADPDNQPYAGTRLDSVAQSDLVGSVDCTAFTTALLEALLDARVSFTARARGVCMSENDYDCHAVPEVYGPTSERWIALDPTFGFLPLRADGSNASVDDISAAARASTWSALQFNFVTSAGSGYANAYYLDYPLMFVDLESTPGEAQVAPVQDLTPYFAAVGQSVTSYYYASYALQCAAGYTSASVNQDGTIARYPCDATTGFSHVFVAANLSAVPGDASLAGIWRARRFIF